MQVVLDEAEMKAIRQAARRRRMTVSEWVKLASTLEGLGLAAFGDEGDAFEPEIHEAVQHEGDGSNPVLGTVMRKGYRLGEQVLRHAMVAVVDAVENIAGDDDTGQRPDTPTNS